jgi:hypothetical protein
MKSTTAKKNARKKEGRMAGAYVEEEMHKNLTFIAESEHRTLADHIRKLIADEIESKADLLETRKRTPSRK